MAKHDPEINPYAAPSAPIGDDPSLAPVGDAEAEAEAESVRRKYLSHETSVRTIASLHFLVACLGGIGLVIALAGLGRHGNTFESQRDGFLIAFAFIALHFVLGNGLNRLKPWARWVEAAFLGLVFLVMTFLGYLGFHGYFLVGNGGDFRPGLITGAFALIPGYLLYLLLGRKGRVVFSREYRDVIARTPQIKPRTNGLAWALLGLVVLMIGAFSTWFFAARKV